MFASIGRTILRYFSKEILLLLFNSLTNFYQNLMRKKASEKTADKAAEKYANNTTPNERDKNAEDLLNRT